MADFRDIKVPWYGWTISKELGKGTFGAVYEIERKLFDSVEKAAMKVIPIPADESMIDSILFSTGYDQDAVEKSFQKELKKAEQEYVTMNKLKGITNIVSCEDFAYQKRENNMGYYVFIRMELLKSLKLQIRERRRQSQFFSEEEVLRIGRDVCRALVACEQRDLIHRDIKPSNILVSDYGDYKIGDFGTARGMDHTTHATYAGTQSFMAPEVFRREQYGKTVDIYSLGLVMYWLMNRCHMPFVPLDVIPGSEDLQNAETKRIRGDALPAPCNASDGFAAIILKACQPVSDDRYQSAVDMLRDITDLQEGRFNAVSTAPAAEVSGGNAGAVVAEASSGNSGNNGAAVAEASSGNSGNDGSEVAGVSNTADQDTTPAPLQYDPVTTDKPQDFAFVPEDDVYYDAMEDETVPLFAAASEAAPLIAAAEETAPMIAEKDEPVSVIAEEDETVSMVAANDSGNEAGNESGSAVSSDAKPDASTDISIPEKEYLLNLLSCYLYCKTEGVLNYLKLKDIVFREVLDKHLADGSIFAPNAEYRTTRDDPRGWMQDSKWIAYYKVKDIDMNRTLDGLFSLPARRYLNYDNSIFYHANGYYYIFTDGQESGQYPKIYIKSYSRHPSYSTVMFCTSDSSLYEARVVYSLRGKWSILKLY